MRLLLATVLLFVALPAGAQPGGWHPVESDGCGVSVSFPGPVETHERSGEGGAVETRVRAVRDGLGFVAYCSTLPAGALDGASPEAVADDWLAALRPAPLDVRPVTLGERAGRAFVVQSEVGYVYGRVFVGGGAVLMLQVVGPSATSATPPGPAVRFLESARLAEDAGR